MGRYGINDNFALAARGEYWSNAVPGADRVNQEEVTVGAAFPMGGRLELRAEVRADFAENAFPDKDGVKALVESGHRDRGGARLVLGSPHPEQKSPDHARVASRRRGRFLVRCAPDG